MMITLLLVWFALLVALLIFAIGRPREGGALTLAYFLGMSLIHVPGVLSHLDTNATFGPSAITRLGFEMTLMGMAAFVLGAIVARLIDKRDPLSEARPSVSQVSSLERAGWRALAVGGCVYFVLMPFASGVPSLSSIFASVATLLVLGFWLHLYSADALGDGRRTVRTLLLTPILPLSTLVLSGFIGYGTIWAISVVSFLYVIARRRLMFFAAAPVIAFAGLSLFVTYMGEREGIREVIWYQQAPLLQRLDRTTALATEFELLDLNSPRHRGALDGRLNQNYLVGAGVKRHQDGLAKLAYGATVPWWAPIPRALWPDKPEIGGGGTVVTDFTAIRFSSNTSVGAGQVLEFYINFGLSGVIAGFLALGFALRRLDRAIMRALAESNLRGVLVYSLPGLMLLQPGGNLLEILVGVISAGLASYPLIHFDILGPPATQRSVGSAHRIAQPVGTPSYK
jgi:hypothetical protein